MTPSDVLARGLAAALLDGDWEPKAMLARVQLAVDEPGPWLRTLVRAARSRYATAPIHALHELAAWISAQDVFIDAIYEPVHLVRYATPPHEMTESPWPVPPLATTKELAVWLGLSIDELDVLADRRGISRSSPNARARHYRYAWIPKPSGGHRLVEAPKWRLRTIQRRVLEDIVDHLPPHDAAHGFRRGRSVISSAQPHINRAVVIRVDLQAFFSSVSASRVTGILRTAGYPAEVALTIAALCTHRTPADVLVNSDPHDRDRLRTRHLPQGAPTSGALANLAAYRLDVRVAGLARTLGASYTRYADDLVLSGDRDLLRAAPTLVARLGAIAHAEGFALNYRKTRVMSASTRQRVTGIVVNDKLAVSRADLDQLRAILHNCRRHGPATQNRDAHADFRSHLRGRIAWVASLDARKGAALAAMFDAIDWS